MTGGFSQVNHQYFLLMLSILPDIGKGRFGSLRILPYFGKDVSALDRRTVLELVNAESLVAHPCPWIAYPAVPLDEGPVSDVGCLPPCDVRLESLVVFDQLILGGPDESRCSLPPNF